jgi:hypothetical protein
MEATGSNPGTEKSPKFDLLSHCHNAELPKLDQVAARVGTVTGKHAVVRHQKGSAGLRVGRPLSGFLVDAFE